MKKEFLFTSPEPAVISGSTIVSYSGLGKCIKALSVKLKDKNKGNYTGIMLDNSIEFIAAVFAVWHTGKIPVLLNTKLNSRETGEALTKAETTFIITRSEFTDRIPEGFSFLKITDELFSDTELFGEPVIPQGVVIFTSGSSGSPKAVFLSGSALTSSIIISNKVLHLSESDKWLCSLPFYHIGGLMIFLRSFFNSASVILPDSLALNDITDSLQGLNPTVASLVPTQLQRLIEGGISPNPALRNVLLGGGSFDHLFIHNALGKGWEISTVYGSTETSSFIAYMTPEDLKNNPGTSGRVIEPNKIDIINQGVIEGEPSGEIVVESPSLFDCYIGDAEETSRKLVNGRYFTGDYGVIDSNGFLYVLSRRTDMIVSGGENIDPEEVEKIISRYPGIEDVCVFGKKDPEWGEAVTAVIKTVRDISEKELIEFLRKELAGYKIPKSFIRSDDIPRTGLGKLRRQKIRETYSGS